MKRLPLDRRGLAAGAAAFTIWGAFPLYLYQLRFVPATQVIAHRISWSCLFVLGWMLLRGELGRLSGIFARPALLVRLLLSALLISSNWLV
jgi:chloramphenicol-sensitive protein RarD